MLLRASRASETLVKEASILLKGLERVGRVARGVGSRAWRHRKGLGAATMVGALPVMGVAEAAKRGNVGMSRGWTAARMSGHVPMAPGMTGVGLNRGWGRTR